MDTTRTPTPRDSNVDELTAEIEPPVSGSTKKGSAQPPQKRVLPSRSRRGGPGVGTCDTDLMILDTMKRRLENEPLVPSSTSFLLTTNSALVPSTSNAPPLEVKINTDAYGRYFDRPEVQTSYRAQQLIQTPEFTQLDEDASVGGRFRPRGADDESDDTSDAAYEKRHRKYETFEKRQRLREKEKLKHEQYKLKERIEQLRGMDTSAFLALPAEDFSPALETLPEDPVEGSGEMHGAGGVYAQTSAQIEGDRRKKEMLDVAASLEERYRTLLDKKPAGKKPARSESVNILVKIEATPQLSLAADRQESGEQDEGEAGEEGDDEDDGDEQEQDEEVDELEEDEEDEAMPVLPRRPSYHDESGESEVDFEERDRQRSKGLKLKIKFPPRKHLKFPSKQTGKSKQTTLSPFMAKHALAASRKVDTPSPTKLVTTSSILTTAIASPRLRGPSGQFLPSKPATPKAPPKKRPRTDSSVYLMNGVPGVSISAGGVRPMRLDSPTARFHPTYASAAGKHEQATCVLMVAAIRNSAAPNVRKTQRNVLAFGTRVPQEIEEVRDFEIPEWVLDEIERDEREDRTVAGSAHGPLSNGGATLIRSVSEDLKQESVASESNGPDPKSDEEDVVRIAYLEQ